MFSWNFSSSTIKQLINIALGAYFTFIVALLLAVFCYPGSTHRDNSTVGYSITHNFLSDLGRTIAYSGEQNFLSSTLFVMGTTLVCIGLITYFLVMPAIVNKSKLSKTLAQVGSLAGMLCGLAFMGVGFTPHNYYPDAHMFAVKLGFQLFLVVMLLHSMAIMKNEVGLSKGVGICSFHVYSLLLYLFIELGTLYKRGEWFSDSCGLAKDYRIGIIYHYFCSIFNVEKAYSDFVSNIIII